VKLHGADRWLKQISADTDTTSADALQLQATDGRKATRSVMVMMVMMGPQGWKTALKKT